MAEKILSLIIPMYNSENFIEKCLDSLILDASLMEKLEVLIINDGSTDQSAQIAESYSKLYPDTFFLITKENAGHGSGINQGARLASGSFIKVLDADDWFSKEGLIYYIEKMESLLRDAESAEELPELILSSFETFHILTEEMEKVGLSSDKEGHISMEELITHWDSYKNLCTFHGIIYHREFYLSQNPWLPERVSYDDAYYYIVPLSQVSRILACKQVLYIYRIGDVSQSVSSEVRVKRIEQLEKVLNTIYETENRSRGEAAQEYWYRKVMSVTTDYMVTAFLRHTEPRIGRKRAVAFFQSMKKNHRRLWKRLRKRYYSFYILSRLGFRESIFQKMLSVRARRKSK